MLERERHQGWVMCLGVVQADREHRHTHEVGEVVRGRGKTSCGQIWGPSTFRGQRRMSRYNGGDGK